MSVNEGEGFFWELILALCSLAVSLELRPLFSVHPVTQLTSDRHPAPVSPDRATHPAVAAWSVDHPILIGLLETEYPKQNSACVP